MKKRSIIALLALVLTGVMLLAFSGCNNPPAEQTTAEPNATGTEPAATEPAATEPAGSSQDAADRAARFCERFNGTWTATDNAFIDFYFDEQQPAAVFGVWDSDATFPEGRIEDAVETAEGEYDLTVRMDPNADPVKMHCRNEN
ncbi:MAG: hypothetical protein J6X19_02285, partial [Clostridia bacterium]|nr:hypothetical protein [Clostridia bacterium]